MVNPSLTKVSEIMQIKILINGYQSNCSLYKVLLVSGVFLMTKISIFIMMRLYYIKETSGCPLSDIVGEGGMYPCRRGHDFLTS